MRRGHKYHLRTRFFWVVHEFCKIGFSCMTAWGFIMYLASADGQAISTALLFDGVFISIWAINVSIGTYRCSPLDSPDSPLQPTALLLARCIAARPPCAARRFGCDQLWTGQRYYPPEKAHHDEDPHED